MARSRSRTRTHSWHNGHNQYHSFRLNYGLTKTRSRRLITTYMPDMKRKLDCIVEIVFLPYKWHLLWLVPNLLKMIFNGSINVVRARHFTLLIVVQWQFVVLKCSQIRFQMINRHKPYHYIYILWLNDPMKINQTLLIRWLKHSKANLSIMIA